MHVKKLLPLRLNLIALLVSACAGCLGVTAHAAEKKPGKSGTQALTVQSDTLHLRAVDTLAGMVRDDDCEEDYVAQLMRGRGPVAASDLSGTQLAKLDATEKSGGDRSGNTHPADAIVIASAAKESKGPVEAKAVQPIKPAAASTPKTEGPALSLMMALTLAPNPVWEISLADKTLNAALSRWTVMAGWQLLWELSVDYAVEAKTIVPGTFEEAVEAVARSMETAEIPMKAIFYKGNKVLRIVPKGVK